MSVVPHDPTLPAAAQGRAPMSDPVRRLLDGMERLRRNLAESRPDCILMIGSDHLCSFFMDNMPPFLVGKAERIVGPPHYEVRDWHLDPVDVPVEGRLARHILTQGYERDVDFAYSDEFVADHALTIPLNFMRPENDLPVAPIFLNFLAPPLPPAKRYLKVGQTVRQIIDDWDDDMRVAVIATGHMTNGAGGPLMLRSAKEPETAWDRATYERIMANDIDGVLAQASWDKMYAEGNNTPGFLGFVFTLGLALGAPVTWHDYIHGPNTLLCLLLEWSEAQLNGGEA
jgi:protocatechuate 4,5-dioxygenase beta chain